MAEGDRVIIDMMLLDDEAGSLPQARSLVSLEKKERTDVFRA